MRWCLEVVACSNQTLDLPGHPGSAPAGLAAGLGSVVAFRDSTESGRFGLVRLRRLGAVVIHVEEVTRRLSVPGTHQTTAFLD